MANENFKSLRCSWEVRGGVIPGKAEKQYTKQFHYLEEEWEKDQTSGIQYPHSIFGQRQKEAMDYFMSLHSPAHLNWTDITWIWY